MITLFKNIYKYNIKINLYTMNKNLNDINIIVEVIIKLNNKLYKLIMKI